jgi:transcriptional regulator with XRE-family HTH domain
MSTIKKSKVFVEGLGQLRSKLGLNKEEFADELGFSRIAVLHWENGRSKPPAEVYIHLAKLAQQVELPQLAIWFWQQAGVHLSDLRKLIPQIDKSLREYAVAPAESCALAPVRPNPKFAMRIVTAQPRARAEDEVLWVPAWMVTNPLATSWVSIPDDEMEPMFKQGDFLVLDESEMDPWKLEGSLVAAHKLPLSISRAKVLKSLKNKGAGASPAAKSISKPLELESEYANNIQIGVVHKQTEDDTSALMLRMLKGNRGDGEKWNFLAWNYGPNSPIQPFQLPGLELLGRVTAWFAHTSEAQSDQEPKK